MEREGGADGEGSRLDWAEGEGGGEVITVEFLLGAGVLEAVGEALAERAVEG